VDIGGKSLKTRNAEASEAKMRKTAAEKLKQYVLPYIGGYEGIALAEALVDYIAKKEKEIEVLGEIIARKKGGS
jgi:hypothetical protein